MAKRAFGIIDVPAKPFSRTIQTGVATNIAGALVLDLPLPPSLNDFELRLGNSSSKVKRWRHHADGHLVETGQHRRLVDGTIDGRFTIDITWTEKEFEHSDIDNRIKALLDYLERLRVIQNDRLCRLMTVTFGDAPDGCRVVLRPWDRLT